MASSKYTSVSIEQFVEGTSIPSWTLTHLERYNNSLISRDQVMKYKESGIIEIFRRHGVNVILSIHRLDDYKSKYPTDANYIIEVNVEE